MRMKNQKFIRADSPGQLLFGRGSDRGRIFIHWRDLGITGRQIRPDHGRWPLRHILVRGILLHELLACHFYTAVRAVLVGSGEHIIQHHS